MNYKAPELTANMYPTLLRWAAMLVMGALLAPAAFSRVKLQQLSADTFNNSGGQHATEVGPDTFAFGSTMVTAFEVGRNFGTGSTDIGFATSTDGGSTWTSGFLPGITQFFKGGSYLAAADPSVVFDAAHNVWIITCLGVGLVSNDVLASTSSDGTHWGNPVLIDNTSVFADKPWVTCDNNSKKYRGHCYVEWDDAGLTDQLKMSTTTNGGNRWSNPYVLRTGFGVGGQPLVAAGGLAVVPFLGAGIMQYFTSTNGGKTWPNLGKISSVTTHLVSGGLRVIAGLPSAGVDGAGNLYVAWQDCRFRSGCYTNDIVMSTSTDGKRWSAATRIPIDSVSSSADHFIPGLAVDPSTQGNNAHLALIYYYYPDGNCGTQTCDLSVGFVSSQDGGETWTTGQQLTGGMNVTWLPVTLLGSMVGDYISTSFVQGIPYGVFAVATAPDSKLHQAMFTPVGGAPSARH